MHPYCYYSTKNMNHPPKINKKERNHTLMCSCHANKPKHHQKINFIQRISKKPACLTRKILLKNNASSPKSPSKGKTITIVIIRLVSCFKMKVRRSIYMISHSLITKISRPTCLKICQFVIIKKST